MKTIKKSQETIKFRGLTFKKRGEYWYIKYLNTNRDLIRQIYPNQEYVIKSDERVTIKGTAFRLTSPNINDWYRYNEMKIWSRLEMLGNY